jgi:endonuclease/exonuclease/phosphatase family metal-dependent hydrolase
MFMPRRVLFAAVFVLLIPASASAEVLTVLTWNVYIGVQSDGYIRQQMAYIVGLNPRPQVVLLQEVDDQYFGSNPETNSYLDGLNDATQAAGGGRPWTGVNYNGLIIAATLPLVGESEGRVFPYCDWYTAAQEKPGRWGLRQAVSFAGQTIQIFNVHLQANSPAHPNCPLRSGATWENDRSPERQLSVIDLRAWAAEFSEMTLAGGDFNGQPDALEISGPQGMYASFADAWPQAGSGSGHTFGFDNSQSPIQCTPASLLYRIDYWFASQGSNATPVAADTPGVAECYNGYPSDHIPVRVRYEIGGSSSGSTPFNGTPVQLAGRIEAENFDLGGDGVAYADGDAGNNGGAYRTTEDVDIAMTADAGGGHVIGWAGAGEWLKYTVDVTTAGTYDLSVRVAQEGAGGIFHIEANGVDVTGPMTVPATGGWDVWTTVTKTGVNLSAGQQVWRLVMDTNGYSNATGNFNWIDVAQAVPTSTPYHGTPFALPDTLQAEDYDLGGAGVAYADNSSGNNGGAYRADDVDIEPISDDGSGYGVGWASACEWLQYTVNVAAAGTYDISVRVAQEGPGGTFHIEVNGVDVTGPMTVPQTGGWDTWTTITKTGVSLSAGQQVWRLVMDTNGYSNATGNFNWIAISQ